MNRRKPHITRMRLLPLTAAVMCALSVACTIEPPLHLANDRPIVKFGLGEVITDLNIVWNTDANWWVNWWYGWDEYDEALYGDIAYPEPQNFEGRFYYYGEQPGADQWLSVGKETIFESTFRRQFDFGYHDMLLWSNVVSADGTQALIIDENDLANISATTSRSRLSYDLPSRAATVNNNPEVFYSGFNDEVYVSRDTLDYDYFDPVRNAWIMEVPTDLYPLVYIYLVQIVIYNNEGRILAITDDAAISSLADGVNVRTGHTTNSPTTVAYPMRMKLGVTTASGRRADIIGGKFTTFGLCDMEAWIKSRSYAQYRGSRGELTNKLMFNLRFDNSADSAYSFDITDQMQRQAHGGIITLEIDADTLPRPHSDVSGSNFDPQIEKMDSIEHEFTI